MTAPWNLLDLDKALRADWEPDNPALMVGEVHLDGTQHGFH
ncbi:hypothetical protein [Streptomyces neyagawaensis]